MKILGRVLLISFVFTLLAGLMIVLVNASGMNSSRFGGNGFDQPQVRPLNGGDGNAPFRPDGGREERGGGSISRLIFGLIKDVGVITILVTAIVWPKSLIRKRRRQAV